MDGKIELLSCLCLVYGRFGLVQVNSLGVPSRRPLFLLHHCFVTVVLRHALEPRLACHMKPARYPYSANDYGHSNMAASYSIQQAQSISYSIQAPKPSVTVEVKKDQTYLLAKWHTYRTGSFCRIASVSGLASHVCWEPLWYIRSTVYYTTTNFWHTTCRVFNTTELYIKHNTVVQYAQLYR